MPFDTSEKRAAATAWGGPLALRTLPIPAGSFNTITARFHLMAVYVPGSITAPAPVRHRLHGFPPLPEVMRDEREHRREIARMINRVNQGKFNCVF